MQTVRTIIWVILAVLIVVFSINNWDYVRVVFWPGIFLETKLPVLVIGAFLLGSLPLWLANRVTKWRMARRLDSSQRELEIYRNANAPAPVETDAAAPAPPVVASPTAETRDDATPVDPLFGTVAPEDAPVIDRNPTTADRDVDSRS